MLMLTKKPCCTGVQCLSLLLLPAPHPHPKPAPPPAPALPPNTPANAETLSRNPILPLPHPTLLVFGTLVLRYPCIFGTLRTLGLRYSWIFGFYRHPWIFGLFGFYWHPWIFGESPSFLLLLPGGGEGVFSGVCCGSYGSSVIS